MPQLRWKRKPEVGRAVPCTPRNGAHGVIALPLDAVFQLRCAGRACAVYTTEDLFVRFDAVAHDTAIAVWTHRRQGMDCALEAIKDVALSAHDDFKSLVIFVLADFAFRHTQFVRARGGQWRCLLTVANRIL